MIWNGFSRNASSGDKNITPDEARRIVAQFEESSRLLEAPEVQLMITFKEAISYFQSDLPSDPTIEKVAIVRTLIPEGTLLGQIFLDANNQMVCRPDGTPYGRQLVAREIERKLNATFGNKDSICVNMKSKKYLAYEFQRAINSQLREWLQDLVKEPEVVPEMTYEAAIEYFVTNKPSDPRVKKGALMRQHHRQGELLAQMFLDRNDQIIDDPNGKPYGRQLVARKLDAELRDAFDDQDLIIVE